MKIYEKNGKTSSSQETKYLQNYWELLLQKLTRQFLSHSLCYVIVQTRVFFSHIWEIIHERACWSSWAGLGRIGPGRLETNISYLVNYNLVFIDWSMRWKSTVSNVMRRWKSRKSLWIEALNVSSLCVVRKNIKKNTN